ncbi:MAG: hypothetical protein R3F02_18530 [Thiolinea sp.]
MNVLHVTATTPAELNLKLIGHGFTVLTLGSAFLVASYLSWEGTRVYLEVEQGMHALKAALLSGFLSLLIVSLASASNAFGRLLGFGLILLSFAFAGLSAFSINTGKQGNISAAVNQQRSIAPEYRQLLANIETQQAERDALITRKQSLDNQISSLLSGIEQLNNAAASEAATNCNDQKYATRCHNQKQETLRRLGSSKAMDQDALDKLKQDRAQLQREQIITETKQATAQQAVHNYHQQTAQIIAKTQQDKQESNLIWSVLPDFATALTAAMIGKILLAMSLIVHEKRVAQATGTKKQKAGTRETQTVPVCSDGVSSPDPLPETSTVPDHLLRKVIARQSRRDLTPDQAEWELREAISNGIAPLTIRDVKTNFHSIVKKNIPLILEDMWEQGQLNRTRYYKTGGKYSTVYEYPTADGQGGQETVIEAKAQPAKQPSNPEWNTPGYHNRAQLQLVK